MALNQGKFGIVLFYKFITKGNIFTPFTPFPFSYQYARHIFQMWLWATEKLAEKNDTLVFKQLAH